MKVEFSVHNLLILILAIMAVVAENPMMYKVFRGGGKDWQWCWHYPILHPGEAFKSQNYDPTEPKKIQELISRIVVWVWLLSVMAMFVSKSKNGVKASIVLYMLAFLACVIHATWLTLDGYVHITNDFKTINTKKLRKHIEYIAPGPGFVYMVIIGIVYYAKYKEI